MVFHSLSRNKKAGGAGRKAFSPGVKGGEVHLWLNDDLQKMGFHAKLEKNRLRHVFKNGDLQKSKRSSL